MRDDWNVNVQQNPAKMHSTVNRQEVKSQQWVCDQWGNQPGQSHQLSYNQWNNQPNHWSHQQQQPHYSQWNNGARQPVPAQHDLWTAETSPIQYKQPGTLCPPYPIHNTPYLQQKVDGYNMTTMPGEFPAIPTSQGE
jgi:hypothetical protein